MWRGSMWRDLRSGPILGLLFSVAALAAPVEPQPMGGLDASWMLVLNRARALDLRYGSDLVFTYGPWGFLDSPLAVSRGNLVLGVVFAVVVTVVAWLAIWVAVRAWPGALRGRSWWAAAVATGVVLLATPARWGASALLLLGAGLAAALFIGLRGRARHRWVPAAVAVAAAVELQIKFSEGVVLAAVALLAGLFAPARRWRRSAEVVIAFVGTTLVAWLAAQQRPGDFVRWLSASAHIAGRYADAMAYETHPNVLSYLLVIVAAAAVLALLVRYLRGQAADERAAGLRRGAGVTLIVLLLVYLGFKQSTVRRFHGYEQYFYLMLVPAAVLLVARHRRTVYSFVPVALVTLLAWNGGAFVSPDLDRNRDRLGVAAELIAAPDRQLRYLQDARHDARAFYRLPADLRRRVGRHPVNVDGSYAALPWAYRMRWNPMPVFQSYVAYTESLDLRNARWLRDAPADQRILRPRRVTIDTRNSLWDPPTYTTQELCRTAVEATSRDWLLLRKAASRCGPARTVSSRHVHGGEAVRVPAASPDRVITMSFVPDGSALSSLVSALFKPPTQLVLQADGRKYRVPRATAKGDLLMTVPATAGWPTQFRGGTTYHVVVPNQAGTISFAVRSFTVRGRSTPGRTHRGVR